jgi:hypothetical protein
MLTLLIMATRPHGTRELLQLKEVQELIYQRIIDVFNNCSDRSKSKMPLRETTEIAKLAKAWCDLSERRRILTGRPLPGQFHPDLDPRTLARVAKMQKRLPPVQDVAVVGEFSELDKATTTEEETS